MLRQIVFECDDVEQFWRRLSRCIRTTSATCTTTISSRFDLPQDSHPERASRHLSARDGHDYSRITDAGNNLVGVAADNIVDSNGDLQGS
jgi:hypothetical protein